MLHEIKVRRICSFLASRKSKKPVSLRKKAVSHQVPRESSKKRDNGAIDISDLNEILEIDAENKICTAEPGVIFQDLVRETLKYDLVPAVVPELKTITIGGAVAGCSIESMSYKHGGFHDTCIEYELITAKGNVVNCSPEKDSLLFEMLHGTFGTLGIITKLKFKLVPAKQYVKLKYEKYGNLNDYKKAIFDYYQNQNADFMDGIIHSPQEYMLCIGNFTDKVPYTNNYEWMKIYYLSTKKRKEDYMRTSDYFFRYDAGCHWVARNYGLENPILRFLFGKFLLPSTKMLNFAKKFSFLLKKTNPDLVVDVFIPFSKLSDFFSFYQREFDYFPLWVVPYKIRKPYPWVNKEYITKVQDHLYIDLAIYGMKQKGEKNYYRIMEEGLMKYNGLKTLISYNYYSKNEFWNIWDKRNYDKIKQRTDPNNIFRNLYEKTCRTVAVDS